MNLEEIQNKLIEQKCKVTPQRKEILRILLAAKKHLSAKEVFDRIRNSFPRASFDTVYRNLHLLAELHIVNKLDFSDGRRRYEINNRHTHHHHLVCLGCGGAWELSGCPLENIRVAEAEQEFRVVTHRFEVFGYCASCQVKEGQGHLKEVKS